MKTTIDYGSDVHLDHWCNTDDYESFIPERNSDVLLIAGDIATMEENNLIKIKRFFDVMKSRYSDIMVVLGNHDYWGSTLECAIEQYKKFGVTVLNNEALSLCDDVVLYGGTMWTRVTDPVMQWVVHRWMNDSRYIDGYNISRLNHEYDSFMTGLAEKLECDDGKIFVVCSHHAPSYQSSHPFFRSSITCGYCNNDDEFIANQPQIKYWIHGHVHNTNDYTIENCMVKCNPRGYPHERHLPYKFFSLTI